MTLKSPKNFIFSPIRIKHGVIINVRMKENITPKTIALKVEATTEN